MSAAPNLYCSFCAKNQHEVSKLIAGPTAFICEGCVMLCNDILAVDHGPWGFRTMAAADIGTTEEWRFA